MTARFTRHWHTAGVAVLLLMGVGLLTTGTSASAAIAPSTLSLSPVHKVGNQPPDAAHGGGGGGGSTYGWSSSNWSGYAIQTTSTAPYKSITGSWTVPSVQRARRLSYGFSAAWIGIDGFFNSQSALIQTGTEQDSFIGAGSYSAWWTSSDYNYQEQRITGGCSSGLASCGQVVAGDPMSASITLSGASGTITLTDASRSHGWTFTTTIPYGGPGLSAEWIMEAPSSSIGILPLADYGSTTFDAGKVNGSDPNLVASDGGYLVQKGNVVSIPSGPDADTDGFTVSYGSSPPSPPSS
jgi:hypothetical protein